MPFALKSGCSVSGLLSLGSSTGSGGVSAPVLQGSDVWHRFGRRMEMDGRFSEEQICLSPSFSVFKGRSVRLLKADPTSAEVCPESIATLMTPVLLCQILQVLGTDSPLYPEPTFPHDSIVYARGDGRLRCIHSLGTCRLIYCTDISPDIHICTCTYAYERIVFIHCTGKKLSKV